MRDFYVTTDHAPLLDAAAQDQAAGLRRLFAGSGAAEPAFIALAANPHVGFAGAAIERLTAALALAGRHTLVVDAAESSPPAPAAAAFELAACIETLAPHTAYLPARGLPLRHVNTRGSSARLLDVLAAAAPRCNVVLVHAGAADLARLFTQRALRPLLLAADQPDAVKHAYASWKLLAQRCGWRSADLLLVAAAGSRRLAPIAASIANCGDSFLGAALTGWAVADPAGAPQQEPDAALTQLVRGQLEAADPMLAAAWAAATPAMPRHATPH